MDYRCLCRLDILIVLVLAVASQSKSSRFVIFVAEYRIFIVDWITLNFQTLVFFIVQLARNIAQIKPRRLLE